MPYSQTMRTLDNEKIGPSAENISKQAKTGFTIK